VASEESVRELLSRFFDVPPARLSPETSLDELGLDSLAAVEIEERFGVRVPNDRAAEFRSVRAIAEGVRALQAAQA
jgi:acyl carrier protein